MRRRVWKCCAVSVINCYYCITVTNLIADTRGMQCMLLEGLNYSYGSTGEREGEPGEGGITKDFLEEAPLRQAQVGFLSLEEGGLPESGVRCPS